MPKKLRSRAVSDKTARELLKDTHWTLDLELAQSSSSASAYSDANGRGLLIFENGRGRLYESLAALIDLLRAVEAQQPEHILRGRLLQPSEFLTHIPEHIHELATKFQIPQDALDLSEASLDLVDAAVHRIGSRKSLTAPYFTPLVGYVGEVIREGTKGRWELRIADDGETIEPWIIDPTGRAYAPFAIVFRELYDNGNSRSIRGAVNGHIQSFLL